MHSGQLIGCILVLVALMAGQFCQADSDLWFDVSAGGNAIAYPQPEGLPEAQMPPAWALDQQFTGRINYLWMPGPNSEFGLQYGLEQNWRFAQDDGSTELAGALQTGGADYRLDDLDSELISSDDGDFTLYQNLDRFYGLFYTPVGDVSVGRQAISFGLAKVFSPVDVVLPTGVQAQERDYRPGVDAARWLIPVGAVNEVDLGWVFGEDRLVFGRVYTLLGSVTVELTALSVNEENHLLGVGTQGAVGERGVWQELAWLGNEDEQGVRWTLGVDQQILDDIYVVAEYHYNGLGDNGGPYSQVSEPSAFYQQAMVVPWGQHYLSVQASNPLTPLIQGQVGATVNLSDGSALAVAAVDWSLSDNSNLELGVEWPLAAEPNFDSGSPQINEEFGIYPTRFTLNWSTVF